MIPGVNKSPPIIKWDWQFSPRNRARPMTYQTTNSLRRSRRKKPYSLLSRFASIRIQVDYRCAGATNGYRMFLDTVYPSAIDDHRNARLGYKACIIAFGYKISCSEERSRSYKWFISYLYIPVLLHYTYAYRTDRDVFREFSNIYWTCFSYAAHVDEYAKITKICKLIMDSTHPMACSRFSIVRRTLAGCWLSLN